MLIDAFLSYLQFEKNYSEKTIKSYRVDLFQFERYINNFDKEVTILSADKDIARQWMADLLNENYSISSVDRKLSSLRSFYKFLLIRKKVSNNPIKNIIGPKKRKKIPTFLKENEINKILDEPILNDSFKEIRDKTIMELFYATGIRLSELTALKNTDVNLEQSLIKVTGKKNKQRIIPFDLELKETLKTYINKRNDTIALKTDYLFVKPDGEGVYSKLVYELVRKKLSKVTTLKKRSPHVLRHTFATAMLNNNGNLNVIKELLGHSSLAATEVYTHTTFEELKKIYKQAHPRA